MMRSIRLATSAFAVGAILLVTGLPTSTSRAAEPAATGAAQPVERPAASKSAERAGPAPTRGKAPARRAPQTDKSPIGLCDGT